MMIKSKNIKKKYSCSLAFVYNVEDAYKWIIELKCICYFHPLLIFTFKKYEFYPVITRWVRCTRLDINYSYRYCADFVCFAKISRVLLRLRWKALREWERERWKKLERFHHCHNIVVCASVFPSLPCTYPNFFLQNACTLYLSWLISFGQK